MTVDPEPGRSRVPRNSRGRQGATLATIFGLVIAVLGLAFVVRSLVGRWPETRQLIAEANVWWLVLALVLGLVGMAWIGVGWVRAMRLVGVERSTLLVLRWHFPGQLGKYIPGGLWPVVGRSELAVRGGVPRASAYASVGLSIAVTYLSAILLAILVLVPAVGQLTGGPAPRFLLGLLPLGLITLHPVVLRRIVVLAERVFGRAIQVQVPEWRGTVLLIVWHIPAWLLVGAATWATARAFTPDPPLLAVLFATTVSWVTGFVVVGVPGGIGVREAMFASLVAGAFPAGLPAVVALMARMIFVVADLLGAALAAGSGVSAVRGVEGEQAPPDGPRQP